MCQLCGDLAIAGGRSPRSSAARSAFHGQDNLCLSNICLPNIIRTNRRQPWRPAGGLRWREGAKGVGSLAVWWSEAKPIGLDLSAAATVGRTPDPCRVPEVECRPRRIGAEDGVRNASVRTDANDSRRPLDPRLEAINAVFDGGMAKRSEAKVRKSRQVRPKPMGGRMGRSEAARGVNSPPVFHSPFHGE